MSLVKRFFTDLIKKSEKTLRTSAEKHVSLQETGYFSNTPVTIDNKSNNLAHRILADGKISINDPELKFKSADISTLKDLGQDTLQADLGEVKVYDNDQILLEDVDPKNIPQDKDIILWGKKAKILAIGRPKDIGSDRNVEQQIFHEAKEKHGVRVTWKTYAKFSVFLPFIYFFAVYLEVAREYYYAKGFYVALDRENIELLREIKNTPQETVKTQKDFAKFYPNVEN